MSARPTIDLTRTTAVVVMGGRSSERKISLESGAAIAEALSTADGRGPARVEEVEIRPDGAWRWRAVVRGALETVALLPPDAVYVLALHGGPGEDGTVQGFLATLGRVHTGSGVAASALCMNKCTTRLVLREAGLRVARGLEVGPQAWRENRAELLAAFERLSTQGWAVKPRGGGSSVDTSLVQRAAELPAAVDRALATGDRALVEERVIGREATCGVLGNEGGPLRVLPPVEIVPKQGQLFSYEEKYSPDGANEFCPPRSITPAACERLCELAARAHAAAGCDGSSRIDFIVPLDARGAEEEPVALEINTLPGMTGRSLLPQAAAAAGLSFRDLCLEILRLACERAQETR